MNPHIFGYEDFFFLRFKGTKWVGVRGVLFFRFKGIRVRVSFFKV
jgi:hypothetical protein